MMPRAKSWPLAVPVLQPPNVEALDAMLPTPFDASLGSSEENWVSHCCFEPMLRIHHFTLHVFI